jgi:TRAP-type mannitol/chloroaromatic compound transport system permease small subunit
VLYGFFKPRTQAFFDLILYFVFFLPGVIALAYAGYVFAGESLAIRERSSITADGPPIYPFKFVIPIAGAFLLLQGVVEIIRCILCLKTGQWPSRVDDVEEVDVEKLKAMVHVDDASIAAVPAPGGAPAEKR